MPARFETIHYRPYELVDLGGAPELVEQAAAHTMHSTAQGLYRRGRQEILKECRAASKPEPQNAIVRFAVLQHGEFYGTWDLIAFRTLSLRSALWDASVQMVPYLPGLGSPGYCEEIARIGNYLLSFPLVMVGGGRAQIREWTFPDQDTGEDPAHQWVVSDKPELQDEIEKLNLTFTTHTRRHPQIGNVLCIKSISKKVTPLGFDDGL